MVTAPMTPMFQNTMCQGQGPSATAPGGFFGGRFAADTAGAGFAPGAGFYPVQWADQSKAFPQQVWAVTAPGYPVSPSGVNWVPVIAQGDVQGVPMMYMVQPPAAMDTQWYNGHMAHRTHTDASSYNGANDTESSHSRSRLSACGSSQASEHGAEVNWVPVPARADVQGVPMGMGMGMGMGVGVGYVVVAPAAAADASSHNGAYDTESSRSAACGSSAASEHGAEARASRSMLRRERRKRATLMRTGLTGAGDGRPASPSRGPERDARAEPRAEATSWPFADAVTDQEAAFCAEAAEALREGGEPRERALVNLKGSVLSLSLTAPGTRLVQLALEVAPSGVAADLVQELHGHVWDAMSSPHANFVLQAVIERLNATQALFIARELQGQALTAARHSYGCRILCRLFEFCPEASSPTGLATTALASELMAEAGRLSWHSYGHHVMEALLEYGSPEKRSQICAALCGPEGAGSGAGSSGGRLARSARNRSASHVVQKALAFGGEGDRAALVEELLSRPEQGVLHLAESHFGSNVAVSLLQLPDQELACCRAARELLRAAKAFVRRNAVAFQTKHGRRLLEESGVLESA